MRAPGREESEREDEPGRRPARPRASDGQALAALRATSPQDGTAAPGLGTNEEAVGAFAPADGRLVSALHGRFRRTTKFVKSLLLESIASRLSNHGRSVCG